MRLVHELFVAALDQGETVPEEGFSFRAAAGARELAVGVVGESALRVAVGDGEDLVEVAVAVGLVALAKKTTFGVILEPYHIHVIQI